MGIGYVGGPMRTSVDPPLVLPRYRKSNPPPLAWCAAAGHVSGLVCGCWAWERPAARLLFHPVSRRDCSAPA